MNMEFQSWRMLTTYEMYTIQEILLRESLVQPPNLIAGLEFSFD